MDLIYGVMRAKIIDKAQYCDLWSEGLYPIDRRSSIQKIGEANTRASAINEEGSKNLRAIRTEESEDKKEVRKRRRSTINEGD